MNKIIATRKIHIACSIVIELAIVAEHLITTRLITQEKHLTTNANANAMNDTAIDDVLLAGLLDQLGGDDAVLETRESDEDISNESMQTDAVADKVREEMSMVLLWMAKGGGAAHSQAGC